MLVLLLLLGGCREDLGPRRGTRNDASAEAWNEALGRVVTRDGLVDYDLLEEERQALDDYLDHLAQPSVIRGRGSKARHAQWLNAYNALVLYQVLERGRPASVLDVEGVLPIPGLRFFYGTEFQVGDYQLSLWDIEHEHLRLYYLDLRDHAAMSCASRSCPPLRDELYTRSELNAQLDEQMRRWVRDKERGVRIEDGVAVFSALWDWYARDFEFWSAGLDPCTLAARYARPRVSARLAALADQGCPRRFMDYDWSLNDASGREVSEETP